MSARDIASGAATEPASSAAVVTPSDSTSLTFVTRSVFVGGAGNLNVIMRDGSTVLFTGVLAGSMLPIRVQQVLSTSTTATNIVALW
jgi:hypothetical protein